MHIKEQHIHFFVNQQFKNNFGFTDVQISAAKRTRICSAAPEQVTLPLNETKEDRVKQNENNFVVMLSPYQ